MRLLLVEDEKRLSDALAAILRKKGYQVDTALDGETGLDMAAEGTYDLLILDRMLPKRDGLSILREVLLFAMVQTSRFPWFVLAPIRSASSASSEIPHNSPSVPDKNSVYPQFRHRSRFHFSAEKSPQTPADLQPYPQIHRYWNIS
mgnify:CR=1 FL=1